MAGHAPAAPATLTVSTPIKLRVPFGVSWSSVSGATRYELTQKNLDRNTGGGTVYSGPDTSTALTISSGGGNVFQFSVRACNSYGCSGWTVTYAYVQGVGAPKVVPAQAGSGS